MKAITIDTITQAVINHGDGGKTHPRLYEIYTSLVKHLHADGDLHLDSDTTFAVRTAILNLQKHKSLPELEAQNQNKPFYTAQFDFVLKPI